MKKCCTCKETKELTEFYKKIRQPDGLDRQCKKCVKNYYLTNRQRKLNNQNEYRIKNLESISIREALRRKNDDNRFERNRLKHKNWRDRNREKLNEYGRKWYQNNKEKRRANAMLKRAIDIGKISRPDFCSECGNKCKPDGHHNDYTKPLSVIWLCKVCHMRKSPRTVLL